jgi:vacuolar-type H+-ATPase subunit H
VGPHVAVEREMARWNRKRPKEFDAGADTLTQLLDREQHLASQLEEARVEAERLVSEAHAYAKEAAAACDSLIEERTTSLAASCEQELMSDLRGIEAEAALQAKQFDDPDGSRTKRLVQLVLEAIGAVEPRTTAAAR